MSDPGAGPLLGRQREVELFDDVLSLARASLGSVVPIAGPAGIGKSRLLAEFARRAAALELDVFAASADELERTRPFSLLGRALGLDPASADPRRRHAAWRIRPGGQVGAYRPHDPSELYLGQETIVDLVDSMCADQPLCLIIDDLQWADTSSMTALGALGRHVGDLPVVIVGACPRLRSRQPIPRPEPGPLPRSQGRDPPDRRDCRGGADRAAPRPSTAIRWRSASAESSMPPTMPAG